MEEYRSHPDELTAKAFRVIQIHGKNERIAAVKKVYKRDGKVFAGHLQDKYKHYMNRASGSSAIGIKRCSGMRSKKMRLRSPWDQEKVIKRIGTQSKISAWLTPD
jgi:hypothetical protein